MARLASLRRHIRPADEMRRDARRDEPGLEVPSGLLARADDHGVDFQQPWLSLHVDMKP